MTQHKIKRFIECLLPVTACNLKCSYCYIMQRNCRNMKMATLFYSPEQIGQACNQNRWGGPCYFSICGAGETTLQPELPEIAFQILKQGHYVNITTNGTITKQLIAILNRCKPYIQNLHISFSFHYLELKRLNLMDVFFNNFQLCKNQGASVLLQFNMCDEYIPYLSEIETLSKKYAGALPQIAATRKENDNLREIELYSKFSPSQYHKLGEKFHSPLFDFTMKNFNVKRKEFCYAGDWGGVLNLSTGIFKRCYESSIFQNVFKNPSAPIRFLAIGKGCQSPFCMNSSHFMSLGIIPELSTPTYAQLRNRPQAKWYTPVLEQALSSKLIDSNLQYGPFKKLLSNSVALVDKLISSSRRIYKKWRHL